MKKVIIFILSILVIVGMTLSFVACGEVETSPSGDSSTKDTGGSVTGSASGSVDDGGSDTTDTSVGGNDTTDSSTDGDNGNDNPGDEGDDTVKVCTHESIKGDVIRFSDYGSQCGGGIYIDKCLDCGEVFERVDTLITLCTYENGESGKCTECGLEISKAVTQNGCEITAVYSATFGDAEIFKELSSTNTKHTLAVKITERNQGNCLVTIATEKCKDCDFTNLISTLHEGGELDVTSEQADEKSIRTMSCTDCGYKETRGFTETIDCMGELSGQVELSLYNGEELLYSGKTQRNASHSWQTTSVKYGDNCKDGAVIIKACNACSQSEYKITFDHFAVEEKIDVDYADTCGGTMAVEKCSACDKMLGITEKPNNCHFIQVGNDFVDGFPKITYKCADCGLEIMTNGTQTRVSDCDVKVCQFTTITQNGEVVFTAESEHIAKNHYDASYDITYELLGESCLDGIITTYVCKRCDHTERKVETFVELHKSKGTEEIRIDTPCGSILSSSPCICGAVKSIHTFDGCNFLTSGEDSVEIDGVNFSVTTKTCSDCGTVYIHTYGIVDDGCNLHYYEQKKYVLHEATIYDTGMCDTYIAPKHTKVEKGMALGPSCEIDGMLMVEVCKNCDYTNYYAYGYHYKTEIERIDLTEHGACVGYIKIERCPCDKGEEQGVYGGYTCDLKQSIGEDENGSFNIIVCNDCGFTMTNEIKYIYENCQKITDDTVTFSIDGKVLYEYKPTHEIEVAHRLESTFTLLAEHCYDGLYEVSKCMDCDYEIATTHYTCIIKESYEFSFREYGVCDGAYYYRNCYCGSMQNEYYSLFCNLEKSEPQYETIDGVEYRTVIATCATCGVVETEVSYVGVEGCYEYEYFLRTVVIGETVLVKDAPSRSFNRSYHELEETFELLGESCEDGYYEIESCTKCDYSTSMYYDNHQLYKKYYYSGGDDCVHRVEYFECHCAKTHDLRIGFVDETENGYACDKCGLNIVKTTEEEKENCKGMSITISQVFIGSELMVECTDISVYDYHSFETPLLSNQDGREVITSKCKDCGFELIQEIYIIVYEDGDWGKEGQVNFTVSQDGEYTIYVFGGDVTENLLLYKNGEFLAAFYPENKKYSVYKAQLEKEKEYKLSSSDYRFAASLSAFAVINGEYNMCEKTDGTIKLTTTDGKYELTLCEECHIILGVQEITE